MVEEVIFASAKSSNFVQAVHQRIQIQHQVIGPGNIGHAWAHFRCFR
jgi:hypothetical protein